MPNEVFPPTSNFGQGGLIGGLSSAEDGAQIVARFDPVTKRMLVDATFDYTGVKDGEAIDADNFGTMILGTDGTNYQVVKTDSDGNLQVDILTMPAVSIDTTGLALESKQDTIIGHVDGIETLLNTIDIDTSVLAATDFATEAKQDDIITAIGAIPGGGGEQYADGTVVNAAYKGTLALGTDGSNYQILLTDSSGRLYVNVNGTLTVQATNLDIRDLAYTSDSIAPYGSQNVVLQQKVTSNDLIVTLDGESVAITNAGITTIAGAVSGTEMQVDVLTLPAVTATNLDIRDLSSASDSVAAILVGAGSAAQIKDDSFYGENITSGILSVHNRLWDGAAYDRTPGNSTDGMLVNLGANNDVVASATNLDIRDLSSASDSVALGAGTAAIGKLIPPDYDVTSHTAKAVKYYTSTGAATDGIIWSPAAGKRWHVTTLFINVSAAAVVTIEDDLAGGDNPIMKMDLAANSGVAIPFGELYPLTSGEDAADLIITTTAGNVYVTAVGYEI